MLGGVCANFVVACLQILFINLCMKNRADSNSCVIVDRMGGMSQGVKKQQKCLVVRNMVSI